MFSDPFPPPGYVAVPSKVEGIEVFAPAPTIVKDQQEVVVFRCPQCGGSTAFSAADGGLTCSHCGYFQPPEQSPVGRRAAEQEFTVETMEQAERGWGEERRDLECQQCGAFTSVPADNLTSTCPFCGSNKVIQRHEVQSVLRPRFLIPFSVDASRCQDITRQWLSSSWMTPRSLQNIVRVTGLTGIYLPYWTFDAVTPAAWRAEVGHTVTKSYYDDGEWKTRTETEWRWESGNVSLNHDDILEPGTARISRKLLDRLDRYNLSQLAPYEPSYLAGFHALAFDIPLEQAWEISRQSMREITRRACEKQASTSQIRNFSMNLDFKDETWRYILLPYYLAAYRYQNRTYQVAINGQTGEISGQRPADWSKIWLVVAGLLAPGFLVGLIGLVTILLGGVGVAISGVGLALLLIGAVIAAVIVYQAMRMDDI